MHGTKLFLKWLLLLSQLIFQFLIMLNNIKEKKCGFFPDRYHKHQSKNQDLTVTEGTGKTPSQSLKILRLEMGNKMKVLKDAATAKQF